MASVLGAKVRECIILLCTCTRVISGSSILQMECCKAMSVCRPQVCVSWQGNTA